MKFIKEIPRHRVWVSPDTGEPVTATRKIDIMYDPPSTQVEAWSEGGTPSLNVARTIDLPDMIFLGHVRQTQVAVLIDT